MGEPFLSEIKIVGFGHAPKGWALCNGQFLPINQNQALFALLGTTYGGNGQTTFALPNLRGRIPIHFSNSHNLGEAAGSSSVTVNIQQLPQHMHFWQVLSGVDGTVASPTGNLFAKAKSNLFGTPTNLTSFNPEIATSVGGSQPHNNMGPYLTLNFVIALQGIFPSQN